MGGARKKLLIFINKQASEIIMQNLHIWGHVKSNGKDRNRKENKSTTL